MAHSTDWILEGYTATRSLSTAESIFQRFHSATPIGAIGQWVVCSTISFNSPLHNGEDLMSRIRAAWAMMRYRFPQIAAKVEDGKMVYSSPNATEFSAWLGNTLLVHDEASVDEVFAETVRSPSMTLHVFPSSSQMMLQSPHTHVDARGVCALWEHLFDVLSAPEASTVPQFGDEMSRLPPPDDRLYNLDLEPTDEVRSRAREAAEAFDTDSPIGLPVRDLTARPAANGKQTLKLSRSTTEAIITACKNAGVSVTAAWHAANARAIASLSAEKTPSSSPGSEFSCLTNFDMRPYAETPVATNDSTVLMASTTFPFAVSHPGSKSFIATAKDLHTRYRSTYSGTNGLSLIPAYNAAMGAVRARGGAKTPNTAPILSSIGVVEKFLRTEYPRDWRIEDFEIAETLARPWPVSFVWTFGGEMVLSVSYNQGHFAEDLVEGFLEGVRREMLEGLGGLKGHGASIGS